MKCVKIRDHKTVELIEEAKDVKTMLHDGLGYMGDNDLMQYLLLLFQRIGEEVAEKSVIGEEP